MSDHLTIFETGDGSHSIYNSNMDETYHSRKGAIQESVHVFLENGCDYYLEKNPDKKSLKIIEIGFGTGLNALLTAGYARNKHINIEYISLEPYPLDEEILDRLNYVEELEDNSLSTFWDNIKTADWESEFQVNPNFKLIKIKEKLEAYQTDLQFEICYFDAFAPAKQPEIWGVENLSRVCNLLTERGILVTYCAQGQFKRNLKSIGFKVESLPGPPGKMEMVRAIKLPC